MSDALRETYRRLDPAEPLEEGDARYVVRPQDPIGSLARQLEFRAHPSKVLIAGQRGVGKSTELSHLGMHPADRLQLDGSRSHQWLKAISDGPRPRGKNALAIDGLEKAVPSEVAAFLDELLPLELTFVVVVPLDLFLDPRWTEVIEPWDRRIIVPAVSVTHRDGTPDEIGCASLREVLRLRDPGGVLSPGAVEIAVTNSAGIHRELLGLAQAACLRASMESSARVEERHAVAAVEERRQELSFALTPEDLLFLGKLRASQRIQADPRTLPIPEARLIPAPVTNTGERDVRSSEISASSRFAGICPEYHPPAEPSGGPMSRSVLLALASSGALAAVPPPFSVPPLPPPMPPADRGQWDHVLCEPSGLSWADGRWLVVDNEIEDGVLVLDGALNLVDRLPLVPPVGDPEALTADGRLVIGSHSRTNGGQKEKQERYQLRDRASGASPALSLDLGDAALQSRLLRAQEADPGAAVPPATPFNLEGAAIDGASLWLGLRGPLAVDGRAIVLITGATLSGASAPATDAVLLDLGGEGVRELTPYRTGWLIVSGPSEVSGDEGLPHHLWWWPSRAEAPVALAELDPSTEGVWPLDDRHVLTVIDGAQDGGDEACETPGRWRVLEVELPTGN